jgi:hypothetical protein
VPTKYGWIVSYPEGLILGWGTDIGAFCYLQAEAGIEIGRYVQLGGGCKIYSVSTIDNKRGTVILGENCKIGSNSVIMPNTIIGENSVVGALSFQATRYGLAYLRRRSGVLRMQIPYFRPPYANYSEIEPKIQEIVDSRVYTKGGYMSLLEARLSHYLGVDHAITCASGTSALWIAMKALCHTYHPG